jgi:hypothetical protein
VARVKNASRSPRKLVDVDVADAYLVGIAIERSEPPFSQASHVPLDNTMSHTFNLTIPPGAEVVVTFHAQAVRAGDYSGDVDVCIDSQIRCLSYPIRTVVADR